ncbi:class I SAM-dependent methyltransferase [Mesorhizobium sp. M1A.F.Ca.IN.020.03.2.1]|uniref:class I SAM-dependent methyltransferase n=1 Tax=unclassified Mesorhizobium TaxID=325217 RepID=UPI000FCBA618|nr:MULTISPECIES: class I SAM-dependent methyltransferase [unclassified Mesorhizobium]RUV02473.1 class I SAM-dependent methyltransferase [Mesorhizobium sp. M1A.F.Ca.IN.020.03.2.1]RUV20546.1 class I SAM-dependent methyltransferase [Mesorhizobium sp. M1A.F.Ca.IN.022.04.1.1]RWB25728.1 MAG: class I SAM-dependent methyltransferase [Mesorhizobium sp.]RWD09646.1 MAG: class I SAM-dependent methyltransferase [Mesorhizobium sp.]RWE64279.1 MAG: class I SAM-dependent methyltransferase [Mesorhizobium sp.]
MNDKYGKKVSLQELELYFNEDYVHFGDVINPPEASNKQADSIWGFLSISQDSSILELGCGYGRITNRLAKKGARVSGIDISPVLLKKAEADAAKHGVTVEYVLGDMRSLPWRDRFDAAFLWYTTFGYFDDADNSLVLREAASALRNGGRLLIDYPNRFSFPSDKSPDCYVVQRNDDIRIDIYSNDVLSDRVNLERIIVRNGCVRRTHLSYRQYGFSEYARILRGAGFETVEAYAPEGGAFTSDSARLVVVARK